MKEEKHEKVFKLSDRALQIIEPQVDVLIIKCLNLLSFEEYLHILTNWVFMLDVLEATRRR